MKKTLFLVCLVYLVCGCSLFKDKTPPTPEPTRVVIDFEAAEDVNPNVSGRASTVLVRIYHLKSSRAFDNADFMELYDQDAKVLGGDLEDQQEIFLQPLEKRTVHFKTSDDVTAIGILAAFRDYDHGTCKMAVGVRKNKTTVYHVYLKGADLKIKQ